jgi:hypothetical protein
MGTRNLTAVYLDGEYKIAQYGQWDGYPEGQGMTAINFLRIMDEDKFKQALRNSSYIDSGELQALWRQYGADEHGLVSLNDMDRMKNDHPEYSRDTGAEILQMVQEHTEGMKLQNSIAFAADGLFCEWAWVIDLDKRTFEAYEGFGKEPLTENDRFYFLKDLEENGYSPVRLVATWSLDELPSDEDFLAAFKEE